MGSPGSSPTPSLAEQPPTADETAIRGEIVERMRLIGVTAETQGAEVFETTIHSALRAVLQQRAEKTPSPQRLPSLNGLSTTMTRERQARRDAGEDVPPDDTPVSRQPTPACTLCNDAGFVKKETGYIPAGPTSHTAAVNEVAAAQAVVVECDCRRARRRSSPVALLDMSGIPERQRAWTFATFRSMDEAKATALVKVAEAADAVVAGEAVNMRLVGGTGTGKSHLASAFVRELADHGVAALYVYAPDMLDTIREAYGEGDNAAARYFDGLLIHPVLVLDDIAADKVTEWAEGRLTALIHARLHAGRSTVVTTDLTDDALAEKLGARIASRLREYQRVDLGTLDMRGTG